MPDIINYNFGYYQCNSIGEDSKVGRDDFQKLSEINSALIGLSIRYQNLKGHTCFSSYKVSLDPPRTPPVR